MLTITGGPNLTVYGTMEFVMEQLRLNNSNYDHERWTLDRREACGNGLPGCDYVRAGGAPVRSTFRSAFGAWLLFRAAQGEPTDSSAGTASLRQTWQCQML